MVVAACGDDGAATTTTAGDRPPGIPDFCLDIPGALEAEADGSGVNVGLTFDLLGRGDQSFNDSAACGVDWAKARFGITVTEVTPTDAAARATDLQAQAEISDLVIGNGFSFEFAGFGDAVAAGSPTVCENNPDVNFVIIDAAMLDFSQDPPAPYCPNTRGAPFAEHEGSFLVGVAAALKSATGKIGFIGGVSGIGLIEKFEAGFIAGARAIDPDIEVVSQYISEFPSFAGFESPDRAREIALAMYDEGADIVYAAAGLSGSGMFEAARVYSEDSDTKVWGIGVDSDQYLTVDESVREYVLTSMIKRVDVAVFYAVYDHLTGNFTPGPTEYSLALGALGYSTSGGFVDDIVDEIDGYAERIASGEIVVPTAP
jgi:basic membrane protein A and related proteins